jgi:penicillin-binding protein 2
MPLDPVTERRPPVSPQMAVRVAGLSVVAFVLFGIIFFRLWYLQVLDGDKYLAQARQNRIRTERIEAPRGTIVDRHNVTLVDNRKATVVSIDPRSIPASMRTAIADWGQELTARAKRPKGKRGPKPPAPQAGGALLDLYRRLGTVLGMRASTINQKVVGSILQLPYADVRIKTDVTQPQRDYIAERRDEFRGVTADEVFVRSYRAGTLAAQLLGTVGEINDTQVGTKGYQGIPAGTEIGQNGLEARYDRYLRGQDGTSRIEVNAAGERRRALAATDPQPGRTLKLTLDQDLQQAGEDALRKVGEGRPGAFVAMDPRDGKVYAMGSYPTYKPSDATPGRYSTAAQYAAKFLNAGSGHPLINRADESAYPTGSVFKPITAIAAMSAGVWGPNETFDDQGCFQTGARKDIDVSCNAGNVVNGPVDLVDALRVSSDVYFYHLGKLLYDSPTQALQTWSKRLGLGRRTGIDLPGEAEGTVPGPEWVAAINRKERACRKARHVSSCGYGSGDAVWNPGNETNLAVGQGDLQATPLQMAVMYSTIINGGRIPRPHLAQQIEDPDNGLVQPVDAPSRGRVTLPAGSRDAIMRGLYEAANVDGGTSKTVFDGGWPRSRYPVYGKTGTAERFYGPAQIERDQAWYVAYSYDAEHPDRKPIVVVATVEESGFGATYAAPIARLILSKWFGVQPKLVRGDSATR